MTEPLPVPKIEGRNLEALVVAAVALAVVALVMQMRSEMAVKRELQRLRNDVDGAFAGNRANGTATAHAPPAASAPPPAPSPPAAAQDEPRVHLPTIATPPPGAVVQNEEGE